MKLRPVGAELFHADRRTGRHDEVNSRFSQLGVGAKKRALLVTCKDVGLEVIVNKTKYTFMPGEQTVGQNLKLRHKDVLSIHSMQNFPSS